MLTKTTPGPDRDRIEESLYGQFAVWELLLPDTQLSQAQCSTLLALRNTMSTCAVEILITNNRSLIIMFHRTMGQVLSIYLQNARQTFNIKFLDQQFEKCNIFFYPYKVCTTTKN